MNENVTIQESTKNLRSEEKKECIEEKEKEEEQGRRMKDQINYKFITFGVCQKHFELCSETNM